MMASALVHPPLATTAAAAVTLRAEQVSKVFGATAALKEVDFNVYQGKVNVLIGENGAGKSTLMKIIAGVERPTAGRLLLDGEEVQFGSTRDAAARGIGIIYQELNLFPNLSVTENIFMAREQRVYGLFVDTRAQEAVARELLERLEQPINPRTLVSELSLGQQQIVEIAKALAQNVRILIMDEPTSALSTTEVAVLFRIIRELKAQGVSIIYISHKLDELLQIGDYVTVLRDGKLVAEAPAAMINVSWIITQMVGQERSGTARRREHALGEELLRVEGLNLANPSGGLLLADLSFTLRAGEIVGIYGLMGAGRTELCECLMGLHPRATGSVSLAGTLLRARSIKDRIEAGLVLVPEDRQRAGLVQSLSVSSNITLASLRQHARRVLLSPAAERASVSRLINELRIKVTNPQLPITALSGGNQQKVVVAKGLLTAPKVLLLDEPTRGIDVGAKAEMFEIMARLAAQGLGILYISSELKEIMAMADRILVMSKGRLTGMFERAEATEEALVAASAVGHGPAGSGEEDGIL